MDSISDGEAIPKNFEQLRNASSKWNLKGDAALLQILENIHKDIVTKAVNTKDKCHSNASNLSAASISLLNVNNRFSELCNTQFVENKVQEDEIIIIKENKEDTSDLIINDEQTKLKNKEDDETVIKERISNSVLKSLQSLEELCEEIRISLDTDSESEDDVNNTEYNVILRPKDPYGKARLPYIIGSEKWLKMGHTDLQESMSEDDLENELDSNDESHFSNSDDSREKEKHWNTNHIEGNPLQIPNISKSSENQSYANSSTTCNSSDTADLDITRTNIDSSTPLNKTTDHPISDVPHSNIPAPQTLVKPSDFAAELARKLGTVPTGNTITKTASNESPAINPKISTKPKSENHDKQPFKPTPRITNNIFLDEPPPLESFSEKRTGLFESDDDDSDDISSGLFGGKDTTEPLFTSKTTSKNKSTYSDLFDDIPDDEDDSLFNTSSIKNTNKLTNSSKPPDTQKEITNKISKEISQKKLIGKSKISQNNDSLFNDSESDDNMFSFSKKSNTDKTEQNDTSATKPITKKLESKSTSLFDDISDSDSDLFGSSTKFKNNQISTKTVINKQVSTPNPLTVKKSEKKSSSIFDDSDSNSEIDEISNNDSKSLNVKNDSISLPNTNQTTAKKSSIFDDLSDRNSDSSDKKTIETKDKLETPNTKINPSVSKIAENKTTLSNVTPSISNIRETKIPPFEENVSNKPNMTQSKSFVEDDTVIRPTITDRKSKVEDPNSNAPLTKLESANLASGLFDDLPPPLTTSSISDEGNFNAPDDLFTTVGKTIDDKFADPLFDDDVDIFSDVPPEYKSESKNQKPSDLFADDEDIHEDNYADYPYFKKVNFIPKSTPDELDKSNLVSEKHNIKTELITNKAVGSSLFSDSDDDLFGEKKTTLESTIKNKKSSLFNDSSDEDKLFNNSKISSSIASEETSVIKNKPEKTTDSIKEVSKNNPVKAPKPSLNTETKIIPENRSSIKSNSEKTNTAILSNLVKEQVTPVIKEKPPILPSPSSISNLKIDKETCDVKKSQPEKSEKVSTKPEEIDGSVMSISKKADSPPPQKLPKLNINVKALLPSANKTVGEINKTIKELSNPQIISNPIPENSTIEKKENPIITSVSFDDNPKSSDSTLRNDLVKNRAKIQIKRRPSSRNARHEAARKSAADIYQNIDEIINDKSDYSTSLPTSPEKVLIKNNSLDSAVLEPNPKKIVESESNLSVPSNVKASQKPDTSPPTTSTEGFTKTTVKSFFEDSDDEDLFASNKTVKKDLFKSDNKGAIKKKMKKNIFDDSDSDSDLFSYKKNQNTAKKTTSKEKPKSIFDDDDSDDQLFVPNKNSKLATTNSITPDDKYHTPVAKPLFDDDDDDYDDIFSTKKNTMMQKPNTPAVKVAPLKKQISKTGDKDSFEDPLSSFLNS